MNVEQVAERSAVGLPGSPPAGTRHPDGSGRRGRTLADEILVARAAAGDPRAFEQLVRRYQRQMYAVALRIVGRPDDAEDAAQNAFIVAWRRLPDFRGEAKFSTWLYRIVVNHALNQIRSRARSDATAELSSLLDDDQPVTSETSPAEHAETSELVRQVRVALAELPVELRVCWMAREIDHCSYAEVATIAGVGLDTARGRIFRARQRLAHALEAWR